MNLKQGSPSALTFYTYINENKENGLLKSATFPFVEQYEDNFILETKVLIFIYNLFSNHSTHIKIQKQAGAELGQAQLPIGIGLCCD